MAAEKGRMDKKMRKSQKVDPKRDEQEIKIPAEIVSQLYRDYAFAANHRQGFLSHVDEFLFMLRTVELLEEISEKLTRLTLPRT